MVCFQRCVQSGDVFADGWSHFYEISGGHLCGYQSVRLYIGFELENAPGLFCEYSIQSMNPVYSPQEYLYQPGLRLTSLRRISIAPAIADTQQLPVLA